MKKIVDGKEIEMTQDEIADFEVLRDSGVQEIGKLRRINELKSFLAQTDYVALSDYDKEKTDVLKQRQEWRQELRELES